MKLTIGMATFDDYDGVYFTIQALRMYHPEVMANTELIVVDNKPDSKASPMIKSLMENWAKVDNAGTRYIPMAEPQGTTAPRQRIFDEARGEVVLCMDSHVFIVPGALEQLHAYFAHCGFNQGIDLYSGPMLYDDLRSTATHFDNVWRSQMWGIWGDAWTANHPTQPPVTILQAPDGTCSFHKLAMSLEQVAGPTNVPYGERNKILPSLGYSRLAEQDQSFEIPAMGLGLFACRKDAWLGFNPHFKGFGGEEMYIHEKFRKAGRKAVCLPWLKWGHRFGRPEGTKYVPLLFNKVRNYVLGHNELGIPLDPVYKHFVEDLKPPFPAGLWHWLVADPIAHHTVPQPTAAQAAAMDPAKVAKLKGLPQPRMGADLSEVLDFLKALPRDLDKHLDTLSGLAEQCDTAVEITHRRESTAALIKAKHLISYNAEIDPLLTHLVDLHPDRIDLHHFKLTPTPFLPEIPDTELLFLDTYHTADRLYKELTKYHKQVRRWIVIHDTQLFRESGEGHTKEKPVAGLLVGMRLFMKQNPEWSVIKHTHEQFGLTVLGKLASDKPKLPSLPTMAANLTAALATYVGDGMKQVSKETLNERLDICNTCPQRNNNRCAVCGCNLSAKATMRSMECPLGYWPAQPPLVLPPEKQATEQMAS